MAQHQQRRKNLNRKVNGENGYSDIELNANGTFTYFPADVRKDAIQGHSNWRTSLENGGYLYIQARDYMQSKAVGDGSFVGAAEWLAGEKAASLVLSKLTTKILVSRTTNALIHEGENAVFQEGTNLATRQ